MSFAHRMLPPFDALPDGYISLLSFPVIVPKSEFHYPETFCYLLLLLLSRPFFLGLYPRFTPSCLPYLSITVESKVNQSSLIFCHGISPQCSAISPSQGLLLPRTP
jgi:hypothetical protein